MSNYIKGKGKRDLLYVEPERKAIKGIIYGIMELSPSKINIVTQQFVSEEHWNSKPVYRNKYQVNRDLIRHYIKV